ncbi:conserved hypothetical phage protein [Citrobacter phage CR44b]|uniref:Conserved hypothetical phage protein n=1 Tax=Citrobacter phage CR44b TaxID=1455075 RepID=W6PNZ2_9CAUD|nr:hypothetical protein CF82_gp17 [Citrobacter phage CR44b]CDM21544.1 conserved hypothetical phage protein [Citrobacter phage CR44b]
MTQKYRLKANFNGWPAGTIVTKCTKDPYPTPGATLVETSQPGFYKHGAEGYDTQPDGMWGAWVVTNQLEEIVEDKPQVLPAASVPPVTVKREVLTINKIGVGQTFIIDCKPDEVYVKISNSHVFSHKRLQMHTTNAQRFQSHLSLVVVELVVYNGK